MKASHQGVSPNEGTRHPVIPKATYGAGECKPSWLQWLANMKGFTANIGLIFFVQIAAVTYTIGTIRTLEKRFSLNSQHMGVLASLGDILQVFLALIIGYFARKTHKPRFISISILLLAAGVFLAAMPYFIFGTKEDIVASSLAKSNRSLKGGNLCSATDDLYCPESNDHNLSDSNDVAFTFFIISSLIIGLGGAGINIMGISYVDENLAKKDAAIYIAAATLMYPVGPIIGFLLAALATSIPENLSSSALRNTDPAFIGAWWLGDVVIPICMVLFAFPLFFFPKHFPEYYKQKYARKAASKETPGRNENTEQRTAIKFICEEIKNFPASLLKLLTVPEFVTQLISNIFGLYIVTGIFANFARYAEIHFLQPAFYANIFAAVSGAGAGAIGNLTGGLIMKKFRLGVEGAAKMHAITDIASTVLVLILMLIPCDQVKLAGHMNDNGLLNVDISCTSNCSCSKNFFIPVCGYAPGSDTERTTYLSPCHAGCTTMNKTTSPDEREYYNCGCLADGKDIVTRGTCEEPCKSVYIYVAVMFLMGLVGGSGRVPATIVTLRIVDPELKPFALGLMSFLLNLLAFIPAPIMFGTLQDSTCLVWSEACGEKGNCLFYDTHKYRLVNHGVTLIFIGIGSFFVVITWLLIRRAKKNGKYPDHNMEDMSHSIEGKGMKELPETNNVTDSSNGKIPSDNGSTDGILRKTTL